jgi:hypothetical protein
MYIQTHTYLSVLTWHGSLGTNVSKKPLAALRFLPSQPIALFERAKQSMAFLRSSRQFERFKLAGTMVTEEFSDFARELSSLLSEVTFDLFSNCSACSALRNP